MALVDSAVVEHLPVPVALVDADGRVLAASSAMRRLVAEEELVAACLRAGAPAAEPAGGTLSGRMQMLTGEQRACGIRFVGDPDRPQGWFVVHVEDVRGGRDPLTGLATREALLDRVHAALAHRARHGGDVVLVVGDLDGFKAVNDTHGHVVGDAVLAEVGDRLRTLSRAEDQVCRWGGDEFVWLMHDAIAESADVACARMRETVDGPVLVGGVLVRIRMTCGATVASDEHDAVSLLHEADRRMYEHKPSRGERAHPMERELEARSRAAVEWSRELRRQSQLSRQSSVRARASRVPRSDDLPR